MIQPILLEPIVLFIGLLILLLEAFVPSPDRKQFAFLGIWGLAGVLALTFFTSKITPDEGFYATDSLAIFFKQIILVTTIVVLIMSLEFSGTLQQLVPAAKPGAGLGEFYALPIFACAGLMWMASANDFIQIFVSLELVTITFYVLVSYLRKSRSSLEAGVKYLILGALSTGILVYGITWIFGVTGQTNLALVGQEAAKLDPKSHTALLFGIVLVLIGLGFKVAAAPFQFWVPDVYQGAPSPVTAFLSVGSKAAGFIVLIRFLLAILPVPGIGTKVATGVSILAFCTLIYGNFAALPQTNLKRLLAYSSIAHAGYLLIAATVLTSAGAVEAIAVYLAAYLVMTLLSFLVLIVATARLEGDDISHFNGLGRKSPVLAFGMLVAMISLAGVPFTAGFIGKFLIFKVAIESHLWWLVGLGAISVACGFYYYLKVVKAMYWQPATGDMPGFQVSALAKGTIGVAVAAIFILGVYPQPLLNLLAR
ncbi:MAG TPA: NADH-quinone oxidoreductase subunit N [Chthoniobacterales bacterium]